ncbi:MAG: DUF4244 domain-containing protein [Actinomycetota bacterium]|nr:DUF4244 domain-containing protein [Actinomycetota bacterium]
MSARLSALAITLLSSLATRPAATRRRRPRHDDAGQATAEYALVLLGVAALAILVMAWAAKTNLVGELLDLVFGQLKKRAKSGLS